METLLVVGNVALLVLGALAAVLAGVHVALAMVAPKTKSDVDDKALAAVGKVEALLTWVAEKLAALLGMVTKSKVTKK